jgi:transcription elongation factor GreA
MSEETYLTAEGARKLRAELEELTGARREELARRLRVAIQQGDLSENADYIAAKEEQGFLEGRIQELEAILKKAILIEESQGNAEEVALGTKVTIQQGDNEPETYYLVGVNETDPKNGRISHQSPIGRALVGHRAGEVVRVKTPAGEIELKILNVD